MLASLATGESSIRNWLPAGDTLATLETMLALGAKIEVRSKESKSWNLLVHGQGLHGLSPPEGVLDCRNAGTCMRLLSGIASGQLFPVTLDGSPQLRKRPMSRITNPLRQMGAKITDEDGRAPLHFNPSKLEGITYNMPVASAQVKSAVLLAALYADGPTEVIEPGPTRDHTERMLQAMGVGVEIEGATKRIDGPQKRLSVLNMTVPGDFSSAAFLMVAASIVPHSDVTITDVGINDTRTGLLSILGDMGAGLVISSRTINGGEPTAEVRTHFEELHSTQVAGDKVVRAIDEFPIWVVAATQAAGQSVLSEASELRVKEVDRIALVAAEMSKMDARVKEVDDGLVISGPTRLKGGEVDSHGDHRLGMALVVAGLAATGPTTIDNADCISDSFPQFVETLQALGANVHWLD
jgi:3-phosphoshikimate 1-carboxyvinyltransferase